ncbi:MAG TPA: Mov34/MPN/PAD-1 family protein [Thermoplasmata archaeon]
MPLFDLFKDERANVRSIRRKTLKMIMEASKSSYPNEFAGFLSAEKGVINELVLIPGTLSGERSALFKMHMLPVDFRVVGTVHSHPSGECYPSGADLDLFRKYGWIHIIVCEPYDDDSWACFNGRGEEVRRLKVVD